MEHRMKIKITGVEEILQQLDILTQKLNEANDLIQSLAQKEVKIKLAEGNESISALQGDDLSLAEYRLSE